MAIKFKGTETSGLQPLGLGEREIALNLTDKIIYSVNTSSQIVEFLGTDENAVWGQITGAITNQSDLQSALSAKEDYLGLPTTDGQVLTSLADGTRSWIDTRGAELEGLLTSGNMSFGTGGAVVRFDSVTYLGRQNVYSLDISNNVGRLTFLEAGSYSVSVNMSILAQDAGFLSNTLDVQGYFQFNGSPIPTPVWNINKLQKDQSSILTSFISGDITANSYLEFVVQETGGNLNGFVMNNTATINVRKI